MKSLKLTHIHLQIIHVLHDFVVCLAVDERRQIFLIEELFETFRHFLELLQFRRRLLFDLFFDYALLLLAETLQLPVLYILHLPQLLVLNLEPLIHQLDLHLLHELVHDLALKQR